MLGDVPITLCSKLQTEIATSTMYAECIAISTGMRELLPIKTLLEEICIALDLKRDDNSKVVRASIMQKLYVHLKIMKVL